jgi:two-component system KDP operon response regulator KdpE
VKILIADDDPQLVRALRITLTAHSYEIVTATNGTEAVKAAIDHRPDLFMIDLGMPELDGLSVIEAVRGWSHAPILVLSGRSDAADKVEALDAGADDYVTKPFPVDELLARIRALTRRVPAQDSEPTVTFADITVDLAAKSVRRTKLGGSELVRLTPTEWRVLELLVRHSDQLVTRQTILRQIWGRAHVTDTGYLRLYVAQLRKKLEPEPRDPKYILTEAGMGYRFHPDATPVIGGTEAG